LVFSISLALVPIATYFGSAKFLWGGNTTYAALSAVVMANIILVAYIRIAVLEERRNTEAAAQATKTLESKKAR